MWSVTGVFTSAQYFDMMTHLYYMEILFVMFIFTSLSLVLSRNCTSSSECGWKATCNSQANAVCECVEAGYSLHLNDKDCKNVSCSDDDCLQCSQPDKCSRCLFFLSASNKKCLQKCKGSAEKDGDNLICKESDSDDVDLVIAVVGGVAAGAVLCIIIIVVVCCYVRKTRRKVNLQTYNYRTRQMDSGNVKQFPMYDNSGFEPDLQLEYSASKIDPVLYQSTLEKLRPHEDTLIGLLSQTRAKARAMGSSDPRLPTYKGVIHQLCRVLVLLHKKDPVSSGNSLGLSPGSSIPSDALGLLQWAQQMLEDHREQQSSSGGTIQIPIAQISAVDIDIDLPTSPVYATPEGSQNSPRPGGVASPYSTVPVPLSPGDVKGQEIENVSGYATIRRTPSIPKDTIMKYFEFSIADDPDSSNLQQNTNPSVSPALVCKEDFQSFLINTSNGIGSRGTLNRKLPPPNAIESSVDSPVRPMSQDKKISKEILSRVHGEQGVPQELQTDYFSSIKKNIITNPNAVKKSTSRGSTNKTGKESTTAPTLGYFANGRYYEPDPRPLPEAEIYAPASSYSDRSTFMTTFLGELPGSRSPSTSSHGEDEGASDDSEEGHALPFDPKDATEPVEV